MRQARQAKKQCDLRAEQYATSSAHERDHSIGGVRHPNLGEWMKHIALAWAAPGGGGEGEVAARGFGASSHDSGRSAGASTASPRAAAAAALARLPTVELLPAVFGAPRAGAPAPRSKSCARRVRADGDVVEWSSIEGVRERSALLALRQRLLAHEVELVEEGRAGTAAVTASSASDGPGAASSSSSSSSSAAAADARGAESRAHRAWRAMMEMQEAAPVRWIGGSTTHGNNMLLRPMRPIQTLENARFIAQHRMFNRFDRSGLSDALREGRIAGIARQGRKRGSRGARYAGTYPDEDEDPRVPPRCPVGLCYLPLHFICPILLTI